MNADLLAAAPWDQAAFGLPAWELTQYSAAALAQACATPGLHTIKVDPLADKRMLHDHGFYYADTLLETAATASQLATLAQDLAAAPAALTVRSCDSGDAALQALLEISHQAFRHGRFHRDLNMDQGGAARRYDNWLRQLVASGQVDALYSDATLAGFIGYHGGSLVLHAVAPGWRGRGLAKHWWRMAVARRLAAGHDRVTSSVSAANVAVLNLYASLGFRFGQPLDIYHRIVTGS